MCLDEEESLLGVDNATRFQRRFVVPSTNRQSALQTQADRVILRSVRRPVERSYIHLYPPSIPCQSSCQSDRSQGVGHRNELAREPERIEYRI